MQPVIEISNGVKRYWADEKKRYLHNENGPAIEYLDGSYQCYYIYGRPHRLDGPARIYNDSIILNQWYVDGEYIDVRSQEEFERYLRLKLFW